MLTSITSSPRLLIRSISPDRAPRSGSSVRSVVVPGPMVTSQSSNSDRSVSPACPRNVISYVCDRTGLPPPGPARSSLSPLACRAVGVLVIAHSRVTRDPGGLQSCVFSPSTSRRVMSPVAVPWSDRKVMTETAATGQGSSRGTRFALAKFRPPPLPDTLITRSGLHERLAAGSAQRLTVVVGSAGAGKSVLLADWARARPPGTTSWLSCDRADADPVRFWAGFIEAPRAIEPWFGTDAADLLTMDRKMSADVTASVANDAAMLPPGSAIIVDDFHLASAGAAPD